ncbi:MAG: DNA/RNA nuclease SfsA [Ruminococcus sp.]|nr:DNA/RNA nuclease SfsA [Ruminococcus sp.]
MKYKQVISGVFLERLNRFVAAVEIDGITETVHIKNTGRCRELLVPRCRVYLAAAENENRKTRYDLIAVEKKLNESHHLLINMDSQIPNYAADEWLKKSGIFSEKARLQREVKYGRSRIDFFIVDGKRKAFLEVKGVTLEENGVALFPDAPTERGLKHIHELMDCLYDGYEAYILFVIQMKEITVFRPNDAMQPKFGEMLRKAVAAGVKIIAVDCEVTPDSITIDKFIPIELD